MLLQMLMLRCSAAVLLLLCCCSAAVLLLFCCCSAAVLLLFCCCSAAVLLLFCCYSGEAPGRLPSRPRGSWEAPERLLEGLDRPDSRMLVGENEAPERLPGGSCEASGGPGASRDRGQQRGGTAKGPSDQPSDQPSDRPSDRPSPALRSDMVLPPLTPPKD